MEMGKGMGIGGEGNSIINNKKIHFYIIYKLLYLGEVARTFEERIVNILIATLS